MPPPTTAPEGTVCSNTRCGRTKSLWQKPDGEWLCWPHYSRAQRMQGQYTHRKDHHDWAVTASRELHPFYQGKYDGGVDYAGDEHYLHRSFALAALGKSGNDTYIEWLRTKTWANRAWKEGE